jgi:5-deoxy-glucuronate isomerase
MTLHITDFRDGFPFGLSWVTSHGEEEDPTGIGFGVLKLRAGEEKECTFTEETAYLLMQGEAVLTFSGRVHKVARTSLFDESPTCLHAGTATKVVIKAVKDTEFTLYQCANSDPFEPRMIWPDHVPNEHRGKGQVGDTCLRFVRTIFDGSSAPKAAKLVLGEVVTMPGRWSSYPPHHHPQPEIYHYRFTKDQGYGHAELGDTVLKVKQYDSVKIFDGYDHAQCAAPGYGMYYSWVIRHLPQCSYTVPEFTEDHIWTQKNEAIFWSPEETRL